MHRLFLLRHGETDGNRNRFYRGRNDVPLNEHGKTQVRRAAEALKNIEISAILSSPLSRAWESAVSAASSQNGVVPCEEPLLLDIDYGEWSGMPDSEVAETFPVLHQNWLRTPESVTFPGGESLADVRRRIGTLLDKLVDSDLGENILLVSHRVPIKVMLCVSLGLVDDAFWRIAVDTASISVVEIRRDVMNLVLCNDTCHLGPLSLTCGALDF